MDKKIILRNLSLKRVLFKSHVLVNIEGVIRNLLKFLGCVYFFDYKCPWISRWILQLKRYFVIDPELFKTRVFVNVERFIRIRLNFQFDRELLAISVLG